MQILALNTDDVRQVMIDHFPSCYQEYVKILHKKERQQAINKAKKNKKMMSIRQTNALKKAMKDSSEYNSILLQQRKEERASYYDMQTQLIHIPARRNRKMPAHMTIPSKYPVALLPGQYQDYYYPNSSNELNQFPFNSVVSFPQPPQPEVINQYNSKYLQGANNSFQLHNSQSKTVPLISEIDFIQYVLLFSNTLSKIPTVHVLVSKSHVIKCEFM